MPEQEYSDGDMQEILRRAAAIDGNRDFSRNLLEQTATELGISKEAVAKAEEEYAQDRINKSDVEAFLRYRRASFLQHFASYVVVNLFMVGIWWMTGSKYPWFIWVILGWGIGVATHAISAYSSAGEDFDREFAEWRAQKRLPG